MTWYQTSLVAQSKLAQGHMNVYNAVKDSFLRSAMDPTVLANLGYGAIGNLGSGGAGSAGNAVQPGLGKATAGLLQAGGAAAGDYFKGIGEAQFKGNQGAVMFVESMAEHNRKLAAQAVSLRWNSHDIVLDYPSSELINIQTAKNNIPYAKLTDSAVNNPALVPKAK